MVTVKTQQKQGPFSTKPLSGRRHAVSIDLRSLAVHSDAVKRGGGRRGSSMTYPMRLLAAPRALRRGDRKSSFPAYWPSLYLFLFPHSESKPWGIRYSSPLCFFFKVQSVFESRVLSSNRSREQGKSCKATNPIQKK